MAFVHRIQRRKEEAINIIEEQGREQTNRCKLRWRCTGLIVGRLSRGALFAEWYNNYRNFNYDVTVGNTHAQGHHGGADMKQLRRENAALSSDMVFNLLTSASTIP